MLRKLLNLKSKFISVFLSVFDRLFVRIFLSFLFCLVLLTSFTLIVPQFDERRITKLPASISEKIIKEITNKDKVQDKDKAMRPHNYRMWVVDTRDYIGRDLDKEKEDESSQNNVQNNYQANDQQSNQRNFSRAVPGERSMLAVNNFIERTINSKNIMQQKLGKRLLIGPIDHPTDTNLKIYLNYAVLEQHYWLTRLFDDPLLLLIFMLIVSLPFITFLSWSLSKPVRALKNSADRVASGHWDNLPEIKGPLEFRAVGLSFQRMIFIIKKNQTEKNQLFANLSHELRTPLARIGLSNALIRRKYPELKNEIVRIEQNLLALETRIQAMLSLSKAQMLEKENLEPLLLEDILMPIIEEAQFEAHQHQLKFNWSKIPAIEINGNLSLLQSAIENILRNALRFAKKKVDLEISLDNNTVILKISDDGKGVLPEELEFIFTPFYRSEQQENDHHGAGLGLAIAKLALEVHKGSISAANQTSGLCIILTLPVHKLNQK